MQHHTLVSDALERLPRPADREIYLRPHPPSPTERPRSDGEEGGSL